MSTLTYGLNVPNKRSSDGALKAPQKRTPISGFGEDSDEDDTMPPLSRSTGAASKQNQKPPSQYGDLSSTRTSALHSKTAQSIDPSIYDYDGVYDAIHAAKKRKPSPSAEKDPPNGSTSRPKPRYINNLVASSKIRERDALRAKDRLLAKEREAEGDEFKDKEKFVTAAYKRQQEEVRKAEAEEAEREKEAERRRGRGDGMKSFYKGMLDRGEEQHQEVMRKVEDGGGDQGTDKTGEEETEQTRRNKEAEDSGAVINEEGDVVDKRQLLGSGLNVGKGVMKARQPVPPQQQSERSDRVMGRRRERTDESRAFEESLSGGGGRENESKKMEDEILAMIGS